MVICFVLGLLVGFITCTASVFGQGTDEARASRGQRTKFQQKMNQVKIERSRSLTAVSESAPQQSTVKKKKRTRKVKN